MWTTGSIRYWSRWPILANKSTDDERTHPMVAVFPGACTPSWRCCSTYGSKNETPQLPPPVSLGISDATATVGPSDAVINGRVRADLQYCSRRIRGEMHIRARIIKAKEGGCYLPPRCPLMAIRGWMKRRCRCRDAERRPGTETWSDHCPG